MDISYWRCVNYFCTIVLLLVVHNSAIQLPSYIRPCSRIDPNIDACALESARLAIPHVINGDRKYRIPPLEPLVISELRVDQDSGSRAIGFSFVAKNASLRGMSGVEVNHIRVDFAEKICEYHLSFPRMEIDSQYKVEGKILLLPITGSGNANITITKVNVKYIFKFGIEQRADGKNYTSPEEPRLEFDIGGRAYIHLKNLFNGDKLLGDQMNIFLNENWEILVKEVGPTIGEAIGEAMRQILAGIFDLVPLEDAFPLDAGTATPKKD